MDIPEKLATLDTQDTEQRQTKQKRTAQKTIKMSNTDPHQKLGVNPGAHEGKTVPASYKTPIV